MRRAGSRFSRLANDWEMEITERVHFDFIGKEGYFQLEGWDAMKRVLTNGNFLSRLFTVPWSLEMQNSSQVRSCGVCMSRPKWSLSWEAL